MKKMWLMCAVHPSSPASPASDTQGPTTHNASTASKHRVVHTKSLHALAASTHRVAQPAPTAPTTGLHTPGAHPQQATHLQAPLHGVPHRVLELLVHLVRVPHPFPLHLLAVSLEDLRHHHARFDVSAAARHARCACFTPTRPAPSCNQPQTSVSPPRTL